MAAEAFDRPEAVVDGPERWAGMSTTRNPTGCTIPSVPKSFAERPMLQTADILGARPRNRYDHVRAGFHDTGDIDGAAPKALHVPKSGHAEFMSIADIDGAKAAKDAFTTNRRVNPLVPEYVLPAYEAKPPTPPPFKRDLYSVDDIEGTKSAPLLTRVPRESLIIDDIAGTRSKSNIRSATGHADPLQVADIVNEGKFETTRRTNPVDPTYRVHGMDIADDAGRRSRPRTKYRPGPFYSLSVDDIEGAAPMQAGNVRVGVIRVADRRDFTVTNRIDDIAGTRAGSRLRGPGTVRDTDPNEREYPLLDGRKMDADELSVGHGWYTAAVKISARRAAEEEAAAARAEVGALGDTAGGTAVASSSTSHAAVSSLSLSAAESSSLQPLVSPLRATAASGSDFVSSSIIAPRRLAAAAAAGGGATLHTGPLTGVTTRLSATAGATSTRGLMHVPDATPLTSYAGKLVDPRDVELARLRDEVAALRSTVSAPATDPATAAATTTGRSSHGRHGRKASVTQTSIRLPGETATGTSAGGVVSPRAAALAATSVSGSRVAAPTAVTTDHLRSESARLHELPSPRETAATVARERGHPGGLAAATGGGEGGRRASVTVGAQALGRGGLPDTVKFGSDAFATLYKRPAGGGPGGAAPTQTATSTLSAAASRTLAASAGGFGRSQAPPAHHVARQRATQRQVAEEISAVRSLPM